VRTAVAFEDLDPLHRTATRNYVDLRAERDVLAVLSNCPQMHQRLPDHPARVDQCLYRKPLARQRSPLEGSHVCNAEPRTVQVP
jgi:uncharacterized protein YcgI (DUF1989 family)